MSKTKSKSKVFFLIIIASLTILLLIFVILRITHVLLHIGNEYTFCYRAHYAINGNNNDDVNNNNIAEIKYVNGVKDLTIECTNITNFDFLVHFSELEQLWIMHSPGNGANALTGNLPSLKTAPNLEDIRILNIDVDNLNFIADSPNLKSLQVHPYDTKIHDLSGLQNKPELSSLMLDNTDCSDYSVLLDLPALTYLCIDETELPDDIKLALEEKGVAINPYLKDTKTE